MGNVSLINGHIDEPMTDNEIKKALECCTTKGASCKDCPAFVRVDRSNCKKYFRGALDLINRLQSENENYSYNVRTMTNSIREYQKAIENYKQIAENQQSVSMDKEVEIKRLKAEVERLHEAIYQGNITSEIKVEVKHGYWVENEIEKVVLDDCCIKKHYTPTFTCSICKTGIIGLKDMKYCPYCGAKMDGRSGE